MKKNHLIRNGFNFIIRMYGAVKTIVIIFFFQKCVSLLKVKYFARDLPFWCGFVTASNNSDFNKSDLVSRDALPDDVTGNTLFQKISLSNKHKRFCFDKKKNIDITRRGSAQLFVIFRTKPLLNIV
jgi:hypothetical protein